MNILIDELPTNYNGIKINTNFRNCILFELLMQDNTLTDDEKMYSALQLFYNNPIRDVNDALKGIVWFYTRGNNDKKEEENENTIENRKSKQIYSYEFDSNYIYSAFLEQYNIDLNEIEYMHWWKFKSLFDGLSEDTLFFKIMGYRAMNTAKIKDKETRKYYEKLQEIYKLPDMRSEEEKEAELAEYLW